MTQEYYDVLIIGAGLSGIGAGVHLQKESPQRSYAILEARQAMGGTWDLFRYPGIRSDSDMYTLGYNFKPWTNPKAIADGESIRDYICETAREYGVDKHIRYGHKVVSAQWSSEAAHWRLEIEDLIAGTRKTMICNFVMCCAGYYNYDHGHEPEFKGKEDFKGTLIHPQKWPERFDYSGKRVVVIGSGATAVTLVPAMTDKAAHVTMLQRSPSYVASVPEQDKMSNKLREYLPDDMVYRLARTRNVLFSMGIYNACKKYPEKMRGFFLGQVKKQLGSDFDMKHFTPNYNPWDERLCAVPNGDMFKAIRKGKASVVTDHIERFTETGIQLKSGEELPADVIITATGLDLQILGGVQVTVDGQVFDHTEKMLYKGVMIEDLPNLGMVFGYTNSSWTLKADLITEYMCRLLNYMDSKRVRQVTARNRRGKAHIVPFLDMQSGYVQRALAQLPKQGSQSPWKLYQNYVLDLLLLRYGRLKDGVIEFTNKSNKKNSIVSDKVESNVESNVETNVAAS